MKRIISAVTATVMVLALCFGLTITTSAYVSNDALYINDSVYDGSKPNYRNESALTINAGDRIYILGWAAFSETDGLKEIKYRINGTEYPCSDVYRDRPDAARVKPMYNNGEHGGYGTDDDMMELLGINELDSGSYTLTLVACSYGGTKEVFKTYTLTVKDEGTTQIDAIQINEASYGASANLIENPRVTVGEGDKLYVEGWASFGVSDRLNRIVYSCDGGEEYECSDVYRDRPDAAAVVPMYNNGEHGGYGTEKEMMELTGISELPFGMHVITISAVSDAGRKSRIYSFNLRVMAGTPEPEYVIINGTGDVNGDKETDNKDVVTLFRYLSGDKNVTVVEANVDINGDGDQNNKDVSVLFRFLCGYISEDNGYFAGTAAYTVNGDTITVNGVSYPNTNNMKNGVMYALDDVNREILPDAGSYTSDGSKNVGLFYFLWMGEHGDWGIFDNTKILAEGGNAAKSASYSGWGPVGAMHFWGEPLYGYYYSRDKWVMRKHIEELTLANVDFLYVDATNGFPYLNNSMYLMSIMHEFNEQGYAAPKIVFYTHSSCANTVSDIYNSIYALNRYPDTWFYLDGKPLIIAYQDDCRNSLSAEAYNFFSYREPQWPNEGQKTNGWPWMDFNYPQRVFVNNSGKAEAISVSVAQHSGTVCFSDSAIYGDRSNRGRSYHNGQPGITQDSVLYGYNFEEQFDHAIASEVPYILVTGWNEWVAQRQEPRNGKVIFVDNCDIEYSRDIEPMRGGYFDNYYMQLINNIIKYKGSAPALVQDTRKPIDITGGFDQWDDILVTYTDPKGDTANRNSLGFGNQKIKSSTGNNDITASKIVYDKHNIYFYAETAASIKGPSEGTTWMQLFINSDYDGNTGFYGFDYIVNYSVTSSGVSTVAKIERDGDTYKVVSTQEITYKVSGNKIMISVPLEAIGIRNYRDIMIAFKWVDSKTEITAVEQMYTDGDAAPIGRLCYTFQNHK